MKLYAVNDAGAELQLLTPFFEALLPAFEDGAGEIRIEPAGTDLKLTYDGKSFLVAVPGSLHNYAAIALSRILILSGMSIALEGAEQTGLFRVRYNQRLIPIHVTNKRDSEAWYLIFRKGVSP